MVSCGSSKKITTSRSKKSRRKVTKSVTSSNRIAKSKYKSADPNITNKIIWTAVSYKGVPYKYGGTTKAGMDCSGLVYTAFKKRNIILPRTSFSMYQEATPIRTSQVKRGDLVFFKTSKRRRNNVNHVGLVTSVKNGNIRFIHSTVSRGVVVSSLNSDYWRRTFVGAKRILQ